MQDIVRLESGWSYQRSEPGRFTSPKGRIYDVTGYLLIGRGRAPDPEPRTVELLSVFTPEEMAAYNQR